MDNINAHIKIVTGKLQQLLSKHSSLQKENNLLTKELNDLKEREENYKISIFSLSQKVIILKAASQNMTEADQKEFEKTVDYYIKEIDKCIGILSE